MKSKAENPDEAGLSALLSGVAGDSDTRHSAWKRPFSSEKPLAWQRFQNKHKLSVKSPAGSGIPDYS